MGFCFPSAAEGSELDREATGAPLTAGPRLGSVANYHMARALPAHVPTIIRVFFLVMLSLAWAFSDPLFMPSSGRRRRGSEAGRGAI